MRIEGRDYIIGLKEERRKRIPSLQRSAGGNCIHLGTISRGCTPCFYREDNHHAFYLGHECNVKCPTCYYDPLRQNNLAENEQEYLRMLTRLNSNENIEFFSFNSRGEPLLNSASLITAAKSLKKYEDKVGKEVYSHLYTNGMLFSRRILLDLKSANLKEIRFHLSASNFSNRVIDNMMEARAQGFIVTLEEPSLPENKEKLLTVLSKLNKTISHLDMIECEVTSQNYSYLDKTYPDGIMYKDELWQLYDNGLVYDLMEEVIRNNYSFSIIDCSGGVGQSRSENRYSIPDFISKENKGIFST